MGQNGTSAPKERLVYRQWGGTGCPGGLITETLVYNAAGQPLAKQMATPAGNVTAWWQYDVHGRVEDEAYPGHGLKYRFSVGYDKEGRPYQYKWYKLGPTVEKFPVSGANYTARGQLGWLFRGSPAVLDTTWTYNNHGQLTRVTASGLDEEYSYPAGANDGRIEWSRSVGGTTETVNYFYDPLKRLKRAAGSGWGLDFDHDGFGNLVSQKANPLATVHFDPGIEPGTNRVMGWSYDLNGNVFSDGARTYEWDVENRLTKVDGTGFSYDPENLRVWDGKYYWFHAPDGRVLARFDPAMKGVDESGQNVLIADEAYVWFGGRRVAVGRVMSQGGDPTFFLDSVDRVGSVRAGLSSAPQPATVPGKYYPFGQERDSATPNGTAKFATYWRDTSGIDYARQRWYASAAGRFLTPDPYGGSGVAGNPVSWNRYAYSLGDPANGNDPSGLLTLILGGTAILPWARSDASWGAVGTPMNAAISAFFGEAAVPFEWRGQLWERDSAAGSLLNAVRGHRFAPGEKLNIVAHSHGGNVAKMYTWLAGARRIDTLITLGTPHRFDMRVAPGMVGSYLNVYSKHDRVQVLEGGLADWAPWAGAVTVGALLGGPVGALGVLGGALISGSAGRTDSCAINIGVDRAASISKVGHSDLYRPEVWAEMNSWLIRAGYGLNPSEATVGYCGPLNYGTGPEPLPGALLMGVE